MKGKREFSFYEFFAGGGMARAGLGKKWNCVFANDFDEKKAESYRANWGNDHLVVADVAQVPLNSLPGEADLAWASFPCQDLSLAGKGGGLRAERSGSFWPFWDLMTGLARQKRGPKIILLENVCGALTSHDGEDFKTLVSAIQKLDYQVGAVVIDAAGFVPQSRARLFVIAVRSDLDIPEYLTSAAPHPKWHSNALVNAVHKLSPLHIEKWAWWNFPSPPARRAKFMDVIETDPKGVKWKSDHETEELLNMMSEANRKKVETAKACGARMVGGVYRRTRDGVQRAEVRFDDISGCLRTPAGGSSRQTLLIIEGDKVRSRLISPREAARLMGLAEDYALPENYNTAYHLIGDGVVVPVVSFIEQSLLRPLLLANRRDHKQVA